jgi:hypothetical protein
MATAETLPQIPYSFLSLWLPFIVSCFFAAFGVTILFFATIFALHELSTYTPIGLAHRHGHACPEQAYRGGWEQRIRGDLAHAVFCFLGLTAISSGSRGPGAVFS